MVPLFEKLYRAGGRQCKIFDNAEEAERWVNEQLTV
jgi:hypothetical protein